MGTAGHPRRRSIRVSPAVLLPLLLLLLLGGCATTGAEGKEDEGDVVITRSGFPGNWLPAPIGSVEFGDDPAVFTFGWIGMIAGGAAAGWYFGDAVYREDVGSGGDAILAGLVFAVAGGMLVGGLLFTAPVKAVEEFFRWVFG